MTFSTHQIKGKGRGKLLGFPTINMEIPVNLALEIGIWAVWVEINKARFKGALHFGPIPTFQETSNSLEVFLINAPTNFLLDSEAIIAITPVKRLREIRNFDSSEKLVEQIAQDVKNIQDIL